MEHAKKMILVPQEYINEVKKTKKHTQNVATVQTPGTETSRLDKEMFQILNTPAEDERKKWSLYQQVLQRYLHLKKKKKKKKSSSDDDDDDDDENDDDEEEEEEEKVAEIEGENPDTTIIESVPMKFRNSATKIIKRLRKVGNVVWDERGQVTIDGAIVEHANIVDLVNAAVRARKQEPPPGSSQFARALREAQIPQEYIGNKNFLKITDDDEVPSVATTTTTTSADDTTIQESKTDRKKKKKKRQRKTVIPEAVRRKGVKRQLDKDLGEEEEGVGATPKSSKRHRSTSTPNSLKWGRITDDDEKWTDAMEED